MKLIKDVFAKISGLGAFSKFSIKMGAAMMLSFYITALAAYIIAPYVPNYFGAMSVVRGSLEAAPASLVAGICAAVVCDLAMKAKSR